MPEARKPIKPGDSEAVARRCAEICEDTKAENVLIYDVRGESVLADFYLVCSAGSDPHLRAVKGHLERGMREEGIRPRNVSGTPSSHWIIIDFGDVLAHVFHPDLRDYYKLEELWDAKQIIYRSRDVLV
jgi:ribosome-associated protein